MGSDTMHARLLLIGLESKHDSASLYGWYWMSTTDNGETFRGPWLENEDAIGNAERAGYTLTGDLYRSVTL